MESNLTSNPNRISKKKRIDSTNFNAVFHRLNHPSIASANEEIYLKNEISYYLEDRARLCSKACIEDFEFGTILYEEKTCIDRCISKHLEVEKIVAEEMRHLGAENNIENTLFNPFIK